MTFTEILKQLTEYAAGIESGQYSYTDSIHLQKLQPVIINEYQAGTYNHNRYRVLSDLYFILKDDERELFKKQEV